MPTLEPVPQTPLRDDPTQDSIWKRWLGQLRINVGGLGGLTAGEVVFVDSYGNPTGDTALTYNSTTDVLTVNGSTFGTNTQVGGTLGVTGNVTFTTLTATRVPFASTAGLIVDDSGFTFNTTGDILTVGAINVAGSTAPTSGWYLPSADLIRTPNSVTVDDDLKVDGGDFTSAATTFNLLNDTVTTGNLFGAGTAITIGATTGYTNIRNRIGVGDSGSVANAFRISGAILTSGIDQIGVNSNPTFGSDATSSVRSFQVSGTLTDGSYTIDNAYGTIIQPLGGGVGVTVTNYYGVSVLAITTGTNTYGVASAITSGATKWNIYASGTAQNAFAGNVRIGSVVAPTVALDVTGAALISTTLGVTGNTTLTGDLAVNGGDLTSSATAFNLLNSTVTTLNIGTAVTTMRMLAASAHLGIGTAADGHLGFIYNSTFTSDGGDSYAALQYLTGTLTGADGDTLWLLGQRISPIIATQTATESISVVASVLIAEPIITNNLTGGGVITNACTIYIASAPTEGSNNYAIFQDSTASSRFDGPILVDTLTPLSTTANAFNTVATTVNAFGAATTLALGAATGTATISNATVTLANATTVNVNGASPTLASSSTGTLTMFNTNLLTINEFGAATTYTVGGTPTGAVTANFFANATATGNTKTLNIGTGGAAGSTTNINLGSANGGTIISNRPVRFKGYTVGALPTGTQGDVAYVTDALAPAFLTALVGGGAVVTPAFYDGTNWVAI